MERLTPYVEPRCPYCHSDEESHQIDFTVPTRDGVECENCGCLWRTSNPTEIVGFSGDDPREVQP